jgi:hypothetical protein
MANVLNLNSTHSNHSALKEQHKAILHTKVADVKM